MTTDRINVNGLRRVSPFAPEPMGDIVPGACNCGARWRGGNFCHCAVCHLTFRSAHGFDGHRDRRGEGRCRTPDELRRRGFEPDADGIWRRPRPKDTIPERTSGDGREG